MAGAIMQVSVQNEEVLAALTSVQNICKDMKKPLQRAGFQAMRSVDDHFTRQMGPDGPWDPLKPSTMARRRKGKKNRSDKILQDSGTLRGSTIGRGKGGSNHIERMDAISITLGTNIEYASFHQGPEDTIIKREAGGFSVTHKTTKGGSFKKQRNNHNLLVFGKAGGKNTTTRTFQRKAYQIIIPARPFLYLTIDDSNKITQIFGDWAHEELRKAFT